MTRMPAFLLVLLLAAPASATDYYVVLWSTIPPVLSPPRNSDPLTSIGYRIGDWPNVDDVILVENLEELIAVLEADSGGPHTLHLGEGIFDDPDDYLLLDAPNTESLTVIGQGDATVLDGAAIDQPFAIFANGRSGMTFRDFKVTGGDWAFRLTDAAFSDYVRNPTGNTIDNVTMENQSEYGVRLSCGQESLTDFVLRNSRVLDDDADAVGIRFITHSDCSIHNIRILDNHFAGVFKGIQFFSLEHDAGFNDSSPYDVVIDGNNIVDTRHYGIVFQSGLRAGTGTMSYVRNNYLEDIGAPDSPNVNGIQLSWCHDLIVEKNVVNRVHTSVPDGHGIIADWAWKNNAYLSDGIVIRQNVVTGLKSLDCENALAAGVNVYQAKNTVVHHNASFDNCVGFKLTRPASTGTVFYNNTAYANVLASARIDLAAPASVWRNNLFHGGGIAGYGLYVANVQTVVPTMSNNFYFNHAVAAKYDAVMSAMIPLGDESQIVDPMLRENYALSGASPAIDAAADQVLDSLSQTTSINGVVIKTADGQTFPQGGGTLDVGAFEYMLDVDGDGIAHDIDNCRTTANADQADQDSDGVGDVCDNCLTVANPDQCNTNAGTEPGRDLYGNACDGDLNGDEIVNTFDLGILRDSFGAGGAIDPDLSCDGIVNTFDLALLRQLFGQPPGPSGVAHW